ncbi:MAG: TonB-dependent siderophore receptor [Pleurocapsa sp. MO_226.B13]|nr:TonB-dependent siderophore receptor [Pleurocapsa sp. MO_226.B13]
MKVLLRFLSLGSFLGLVVVSPVGAETREIRGQGGQGAVGANGRSPLQVGTAADLFAQGVTRVTGVQINPTESGFELVLETVAGSEGLVPLILPQGNDLVIDILDATLAFSIRNGVEELNPAPGIIRVKVNQVKENSIRVRITGENQAPSAEVVTERDNLVLSITPDGTVAESEPVEEIEVIATGEAEEDGYSVDNATVGTRTDTPLKDIPQSIQVVPQEVIEDQRATTPNEALQNVPGVAPGGISPRTFSNSFFIRGFNASDNTLTNGLPDQTNQSVNVFSNIERVEVLKGPASVLFGQGTIGGVVNYVTKQPQADPFYSLEVSIGNFDLYGGALDLSGSLNEQETVLYRLNGFAETNESFIDFYDRQRYQIAPALTWQISDRTEITFEADYAQVNAPFDQGIPAEGSVLPNPNGEITRDRFIGEPDLDDSQNRVFRIGYDLEHSFNDNWQLRSVFRASLLRLDRDLTFSSGLEDDLRTLNRGFDEQDFNDNIYNLDNYVVGEFATGNIKHKLVAGFNLYRQDTNLTDIGLEIASIDIFDPVYGSSPTDETIFEFDIKNQTQSLGLFVQDQINFTDNFIVLLGGRFDIASQDFEEAIEGTNDFGQEEAFSPRVGIVYQPIEAISLYASFARSFQQTTSVFSRALAEPERGTQYEIGVKADISDRLSATLAFYDLTRANVETSDPENPNFTIQTGEQNSQGIELDISGEILPGWNIIAGYAYTDARITEDNDLPVGNNLNNIPENAFNFWTTYEIQRGFLAGLGFGLGLFIVGDRPGDLDNSFELPSYTRTDAAIFYKRDSFRAAVNFRNLFDEDYFISAQNRNRVFPGDPFTVISSLSYEF